MVKGGKRSKAKFDVLDRIRSERDKRGWTDYQMAENSGLTQSTISTWYNRGIEPGIASIEKLCDGFGISLSQFFADDEDGMTDDQREVFELWRGLSPGQRHATTELLKTFTGKK